MKTIRNVLLILVFVLLVMFGFENLSRSYLQYDEKYLLDTINRLVSQCYAIEGFYPADIEYLEDNYGLVIDDGKYHVFYQTFASNVYPEITVFRKG